MGRVRQLGRELGGAFRRLRWGDDERGRIGTMHIHHRAAHLVDASPRVQPGFPVRLLVHLGSIKTRHRASNQSPQSLGALFVRAPLCSPASQPLSGPCCR